MTEWEENEFRLIWPEFRTTFSRKSLMSCKEDNKCLVLLQNIWKIHSKSPMLTDFYIKKTNWWKMSKCTSKSINFRILKHKISGYCLDKCHMFGLSFEMDSLFHHRTWHFNKVRKQTYREKVGRNECSQYFPIWSKAYILIKEFLDLS